MSLLASAPVASRTPSTGRTEPGMGRPGEAFWPGAAREFRALNLFPVMLLCALVTPANVLARACRLSLAGSAQVIAMADAVSACITPDCRAIAPPIAAL